MGIFLIQRFGLMLLTSLALTFVVFFLTNLEPNLEKIARSEASARMSEEDVSLWLERNGYKEPLITRYAQWLGIAPGWTREADDGTVTGRCIEGDVDPAFNESDLVFDYIRVYQASTTSVEPENQLEQIRVFPNPTEGLISVRFPEGVQTLQASLFTIEGKLVKQARLDPYM